MTQSSFAPVGKTTASLIREDQIVAYDEWDKLPMRLQGLGTRVVLIGPDGWLFDLAGPHAGKQGVRLARTLQGEHHWPFELLLTEGAYQVGVTIERTNYKGRDINTGVTIGGDVPHLSEFQYRWAEDRFMHQLQQDRNSWLGVFTRFSGWRWTQVRLKQTIDTAQQLDTTAFGNNTATWDLNLLAPKPYYSKRMVWDTWDAKTARKNLNEVQRIAVSGLSSGTYKLKFKTSDFSANIGYNAAALTLQGILESLSTIGVGNVEVSGSFAAGYVVEFIGTLKEQDHPELEVDDTLLVDGDVEISTLNNGKPLLDATTGTITLKNAGDLPAWPKGIIVGTCDDNGGCDIQDGMTDRMVPMPAITESNGSFVMLDTDPEEVTLVAANDPVDNFFYQRIRASRLLEAFLHNLSDQGQRIDLQMQQRFENPIPPGEVVQLRVHHENPAAQITMFVPQHFRRSR